MSVTPLPPILSTCWLSHRHTDGYALAREAADLGFSWLELSHGIRMSLVPGLLKAVEEGLVRVASTHNFCPLPPGFTQAAPNAFEPTSADVQEQDQWLRYTRRSIDFAVQVGARVVVCHLGRIDFFWWNPVEALRRRFRLRSRPSAAGDAAALARRVARMRQRLVERLPPRRERLLAALREVEDYARTRGIRLGFENRERMEELPFDDDVGALLAELGGAGPWGYWHDTGHAELKQRWGVSQAAEQLRLLSPSLLGFHLHDVNAEDEDHQALGAGTVDFAVVAAAARPEHLLVLELSPQVPAEEVVRSREAVERWPR